MQGMSRGQEGMLCRGYGLQRGSQKHGRMMKRGGADGQAPFRRACESDARSEALQVSSSDKA